MSGDESVVLSKDGSRLAEFRFEDRLRADAATAVAELKDAGLPVEMVSGDRESRGSADRRGNSAFPISRPYCPAERSRTSPRSKPRAERC